MARNLPDIMRKRLIWVGAVFAVLALLIVGRAVKLQIVERDEYANRSKEKTEMTMVIRSIRGDIYDCHLEKLATSVVSDNLAVHGLAMKNYGDNFLALSKIIDMNYEELAERFEKTRNYMLIKRNLTEEESGNVRALNLKGVMIEKGQKRVYPNGPVAAHLLGFVGVDGQGLEGLERALNDSLMVPDKKIRVKRDKRGRVIMDSAGQAQEAPRGASAILTIDRRIQFIAEKAIAKAVVETNAKSGIAIAVRPKTGEIVASAVYPTFDPNKYWETPVKSRRNLALTDPFEPGSTFKIFTVAAALEEGIITPDTVFFCENGTYKVDGTTSIRDTGSYGDLTVSRIVQVSSNIGAAKIGERLGAKKLHNYLTRFSFGEKSGLAYPSGESAGKLRPVKNWHVVDASNLSFGQGLSTTALQLVMAAAAIGNDGVLMRPMLVSRIIDSGGNVIEERNPEIARNVISPLTARQVMAMMRLAAVKGGTGTRGDIPEYPVAAKTGTSQKYSVEKGVYSHDSFTASFVGLAPYENPELCLLVVLDEPWPSYYGGVVAAPVFKEIMEEALPLLDIPPSDPGGSPARATASADFSSNGSSFAPGAVPGILTDYSAANRVRAVIPKGDKGSPGPIPPAGEAGVSGMNLREASFKGTREVLRDKVKHQPGVMPDLSGLTMRDVKDALAKHGLVMEFSGSGMARDQDPRPGQRVAPGQTAAVRFAGIDG
ncbi:MAG: transpeptidase family protein [Deltaproteobacteria bacterium]|jgi:cell division protein FtsI (penicillin-binding protein 3)|nr:transpeptidase family protein [Deltaproteobacteria bacterium]